MSEARKTAVLRVLRDALKLEQDGADFFRDSLQRMENPGAAKTIARLIDEEEEHILLVSRSIEGLAGEEWKEPAVTMNSTPIRPEYFDEQAQRNFPRQIRENPILPDLAVFDSAWRMERRSWISTKRRRSGPMDRSGRSCGSSMNSRRGMKRFSEHTMAISPISTRGFIASRPEHEGVSNQKRTLLPPFGRGSSQNLTKKKAIIGLFGLGNVLRMRP